MIKKYVALRHVRTEHGKQIRKAYENHLINETWGNIRTLQPRNDEVCNTITTVQKDNYILEVNE